MAVSLPLIFEVQPFTVGHISSVEGFGKKSIMFGTGDMVT
jgi:hypothetical protein